MAKSNPLAQGLERLSQPVAVASPPLAAQPAPRRERAASRSPSREGQTLVGAFFAPEVHRQLRMLAAENGATQQALLTEGLNMLFAKYGKPEIAALGRILKNADV